MKKAILVIGSTGTVGQNLVRELKEKGENVRTTTSKKPSSPDQVQMNLVTGEGLNEAFEDVDKAFFLSPGGYLGQDKLLLPLIEESKRRGLKKVVLMTAMGVNSSDENPLRKVEIALEKSGLNYNILRPNWFYQNFLSFWADGIHKQGKIRVPGGQAKVSFVDARDIAATAAVLLTSDKFPNQAFELTGPDSISHDEVARAISQATGKNVGYQDISPEELKKGLVSVGVGADYADFMNVIFGYLREGYSAAVTDSVQKITGRPAIGAKKFTEDFKTQLA